MVKVVNSYASLGYSPIQRIMANLDKCSRRGQSNVVRTPWGSITMYHSSKRGRFYSISGSKVFHNGGSYRIWSLRRLLSKFGK